MKQISEKELAQLLIDSAELHALEAGGVDNWLGYDLSLHEDYNGEYYQELLDTPIEEIVKNYKDV